MENIKTLNPEWIKVVKSAVNVSPYFTLQVMTVEELSFGKSRLEIDLRKDHLQPFGFVHGGVFAGLIDAAGFWAVFSQADSEVGMTTVELKINYLAPAVSGKLIGLGNCIKLGRNLGLGEARVENEDGRLLAHGTTTLIVQPNLNMADQEGYPSKFISG